MVMARLKGPRAAQWNVGGRFLQGEGTFDLSEKELKDHQDVIEELIEVAEEPKEIVEEPEKFNEKDLKALNKEEQVIILNKLGIEKIPRFEKGRIKAIMEAQK